MIVQAQPRNVQKSHISLKSMRESKMIPAVIYGPKKSNLHFFVPLKSIPTALLDIQTVNIKLDTNEIPAILKKVQVHHVTGKPIHVDYLYAYPENKVLVRIPIDFINAENSPGLKYGAFLNIIKRFVYIKAYPHDIPKRLVVDLSEKESGAIVTLKDLSNQISGSAIFSESKEQYKVAIIS